MKFLVLITIFFTLLAVNRAAVGRGVFKDPNHPGKCVIDGIILSPGQTAQKPNGCAKYFCGKDSWLVIHTCYATSAPEGYILGEPINPQAEKVR